MFEDFFKTKRVVLPTNKLPYEHYGTTEWKQKRLKKDFDEKEITVSKYTPSNGDTIYFQGTYAEHIEFLAKYKCSDIFYESGGSCRKTEKTNMWEFLGSLLELPEKAFLHVTGLGSEEDFKK